MAEPSVKRLARLAITALLLAVMAISAVALLLLACPASPRCSAAVGSALSASAPRKLPGCGDSVAPEACDIFEGKWVWDDSYPLYESRDCPFLDGGFRCSENGRPDASYTKWRWQPSCCDLPRLVRRINSYFLHVCLACLNPSVCVMRACRITSPPAR